MYLGKNDSFLIQGRLGESAQKPLKLWCGGLPSGQSLLARNFWEDELGRVCK